MAKKSGERCPPKNVFGIICGIRRYLKENNDTDALNPLDQIATEVAMKGRSFYLVVQWFSLFRRTLDAEMKDATSHGLHLKYVKVKEARFHQTEKKRNYSGV